MSFIIQYTKPPKVNYRVFYVWVMCQFIIFIFSKLNYSGYEKN